MSETVSGDISLVKMGIHSGLGNVGHRVVGRVGGDGGAESLGLGVAPDLTLVGLGNRRMGGLATAVASTVANSVAGVTLTGGSRYSLHIWSVWCASWGRPGMLAGGQAGPSGLCMLTFCLLMGPPCLVLYSPPELSDLVFGFVFRLPSKPAFYLRRLCN